MFDIRGNFQKTLFCISLYYVLAQENWILKFLVSTLHNESGIIGDKHNGLEPIYKQDKIGNSVCFCNTHENMI